MSRRTCLSRISQRDRRAIEQAIARGVSGKTVMADWNISYETLTDLKDEMLNGEKREGKPGPKPVPLPAPDITRPIESYYGPADPSVIEHLIGEMFGENERAKARKAARAA